MTEKRKIIPPARITWHGYVARSRKSGEFFRWVKYYDGTVGAYEESGLLDDDYSNMVYYDLPALFSEPKPKVKPFNVFANHALKNVEFIPVTIIIGEHK